MDPAGSGRLLRDIEAMGRLQAVPDDELAIQLVCCDCEHVWRPERLRRYGDHGCPRCGSFYTGFDLEEE